MGRVRTRLEKNARKSAVRHQTNRRSFPRGRPFRLVRRTRVPLMTARRECWFIRFSLPFSLPHNLGVSIFYSLFCMSVFFRPALLFLPYPLLVFVFITDVRRRASRQRSSVIREAGVAGGCPCPATTSFISFASAAIATRHYTYITVTVIMIALSATSGKVQGVRKMAVQIGFFSKPLFVLHGPKKRNRVSLQNVLWAEIRRGYRHRARNTQYTITDTGGGPRANLMIKNIGYGI